MTVDHVGGRGRVAEVDHVAVRPSWRCRVCGQPWPCDPAKAQLIAAYDRIGLCMYVAERSVEAAHDLPGLSPAVAYVRFLAWARTARTRSATTMTTKCEGE
ncbi:flavin reductase [Solwaraspora sp. WMMA2056]|uniref:flavin reductase n=1 Tax=Solwaraspora sp. WMMA2056 TaxID=3015161 RepID=UPI00259B1567|nr:flavin reductase [Solwaraspora sp. WMMA2056]WJK38744.1 flavin reductase [Solwaraspora sp. WMMA2056]